MTDIMYDTTDDSLSIEHDSESDRYRTEFDTTALTPSTAVVEVMAAVLETDPLSFEPLTNVVDAEALDRLCTKQAHDGDCIVEFAYLDHRITVKRSGVLTVQSLNQRGGLRDDSA